MKIPLIITQPLDITNAYNVSSTLSLYQSQFDFPLDWDFEHNPYNQFEARIRFYKKEENRCNIQ